MKRIFCLLLAIIVLPVVAQTIQKGKVNLYQKSYQQRLEVQEMQDNLLKSLLKVPFEKRVYIYPALFESHNVSKKIITHPQILAWKGKKPTKIAPQMQEYAKENLEYMPAMFYPFLDPDGWPTQKTEDDWHNVSDLLKGTLVTPDQVTQQIPQLQTK